LPEAIHCRAGFVEKSKRMWRLGKMQALVIAEAP